VLTPWPSFNLYKIVVLPKSVRAGKEKRPLQTQRKLTNKSASERTGVVEAQHEHSHLLVAKDFRQCLSHCLASVFLLQNARKTAVSGASQRKKQRKFRKTTTSKRRRIATFDRQNRRHTTRHRSLPTAVNYRSQQSSLCADRTSLLRAIVHAVAWQQSKNEFLTAAARKPHVVETFTAV
jgi:hypothetical protein